ncbi:MAG: ATPase [marine bacterium B5-7]|nr:MAG: ATPase [marine bacterium B5-7]
MSFQRSIVPQLKELLHYFPAVAILGVRQCGKTTLVKEEFPDWKYLDLENSDDLQLIKKDTTQFFKQNPDHVIIDEAQECPEMFKILRGVIDNKRQQKGRFILTGSSHPDLSKHISESLAGRIAIITLSPLKMNEIYRLPLSPFYNIFDDQLDKNKITVSGAPPINLQQILNAWFYGGYPEPLNLNNTKARKKWFDNYENTYLNRDIKRLFPKINVLKYKRFLSMLSYLSSTIINKVELGRALDVNESTARDYLEIAAGTYLWRILPSYEKTAIRSLVKLPKGYLTDSGLLHHLTQIPNQDMLDRHPMMGQSFEGFVIEEILRGLSVAGIVNWKPYYYRTRGGVEVDLILEGFFGTLPIEIKHGRRVRADTIQNLELFIKQNKLPFGLLINMSDEVTWLTPTVLQIPVGWL